jgi:O-antigen/teichoic acid export membrane protein
MSEVRSTFRHASVYTIAAVLGKLISFFLLPFYAHVLQDVGYGVIGMIETGTMLLLSLMAYGAQGGIIRIYHEETPERKPLVVSTGVIMMGVASLVLTSLVALFARPLSGLLLASPDQADLLLLALGAFVLEITGIAAASILLICRQSVTFSIIGLVRLFVGLGTSVWFVLVLDWGLFGYFLSSLVTALVNTVCFVAIAVRRCGLGFDRDIARSLTTFLLPLVPGNLASFVSRQVERVLVRFQLSLESVGVLEMGYKFPVLIGLLISQPFMRSWNTTRTEIADEPDAPRRIGRVFTYFLVLMLFGGLLIAVNIRTVLEMLTPPEFWPAYRIARIEVVTAILQGIYLHVGFGLYYAKDTRTMALIRGSMSAVKVGLSVLFIHLWGLYGAAFSAMLTQAVVTAWGSTVSQRRYRIDLEWRKLTLIVGAAAVLFVVLAGLDLSGFAPVAWLRDTVLPAAVDGLSGTSLGAWKDGKIPAVLSARSDLIADLVVRVVLCCTYLLVFPVIHRETRERIRGMWRAS